MTGQWHHPQALQLTVWQFWEMDFFGGVASQEIFGGNLCWDVASQEIMWIYGLSPNIIFNKNPNQNALEYLAFGKDFIMDRLRLEILTKILKIIFNYNL